MKKMLDWTSSIGCLLYIGYQYANVNMNNKA